jgi:hypothetical protein
MYINLIVINKNKYLYDNVWFVTMMKDKSLVGIERIVLLDFIHRLVSQKN